MLPHTRECVVHRTSHASHFAGQTFALLVDLSVKLLLFHTRRAIALTAVFTLLKCTLCVQYTQIKETRKCKTSCTSSVRTKPGPRWQSLAWLLTATRQTHTYASDDLVKSVTGLVLYGVKLRIRYLLRTTAIGTLTPCLATEDTCGVS